MCYSAQIWADYRKYLRTFGATLDVKAFARLYWERQATPGVRIPKAMDASFLAGDDGDTQPIRDAIAAFNRDQVTKLEQEVFAQTKRLADAERALASKTTKKASESVRIATDKIAWAKAKLADLRRDTFKERDARIFPAWYAPVMVIESGQRVVRPMRYQCRPAGKPAFYDRKYPGTYNARRDNLEGFWKGQFGTSHAIVVANAFFENVSQHRLEQRELADGETEVNVVLEFRPEPQQDMLLACLWSHWTGPDGEALDSFAAITDEPPPEVAAAGHDRCVIPIKAEQVDAWLTPQGRAPTELQAILDDRARPYYEHRKAA